MPMQRVPLYRAKLAVCDSMDSDSAQLGPSQANLNFYSTTFLDKWPSLRKDTIVSMLCNRSCSVRIGLGGTCNRSLPGVSRRGLTLFSVSPRHSDLVSLLEQV